MKTFFVAAAFVLIGITSGYLALFEPTAFCVNLTGWATLLIVSIWEK